MRLKSFHAKTMADAMKQVRAALGDDAIIVATREEEGGGVRVTAAVEEDDAGPIRDHDHHHPRHPAKPAEPEIDVGEVVAETLHRHGVPAALSEPLIDAAAGLDTDDPTLALGAALDQMFTFNPLAEARMSGKPLVLVGPPGNGKTLTVAKIAARAVLKNKKVGVITTDTIRAGGVDQLVAFTRLLKVKLTTVEDPDALAGAFQVHREADLVIVDTAGRNPFDEGEMGDLKEFLEVAETEPLVLLPAGMDAFEAADTAAAFKALGARRILPTRLDIARRLGSLLVAAYRTRMAFCEAGVAPKVIDGLTPLNPVGLARLMMPGYEKPVQGAQRRPGPAPARSARANTPRTHL